MQSIKGQIVTPSEIVPGWVRVENGRILEITRIQPPSATPHDYGDALILPGFIDLHSHGLGEYEPLDVAGIVGMAQLAPQYGTTGFLPTGAAMTTDQYVALGQNARAARKIVNGTGAKILGVHLEGPFINPKSSGAMDPATRRPITTDEARRFVEEIGDLLKIVTFSPELPGGLKLIEYLTSNGITAALGHSVAAGEQVDAFVAAGLRHVVHMFNAFVPSGEKEPGVLKAGLIEHILVNEALTCELICDLQHVAPELLQIAAKILAPDRFVAITDSLYGAGQPDGIYNFPNGGQYRIAGGVARLHGGHLSGALAGSVLTMNRAFGNLVTRCGLEPVLAAKFTAANPARVIGLAGETGSIEPGKRADLAVLGSQYQCLATFVNGKLINPNPEK